MSAKTVIFLLVSAAIYICYMIIIRAWLIRKAGKNIWKTFIPFVSLAEEYRISGRPKWFYWHALTMTLASFCMMTGLLFYVQAYLGHISSGMTPEKMLEIYNIMVAASVVLYLASLPARFAKAYGLERCFGEPQSFDYAIGIIFFPWAFKARLAFSKKIKYELKKPKKRKRKKFKMPSFFS